MVQIRKRHVAAQWYAQEEWKQNWNNNNNNNNEGKREGKTELNNGERRTNVKTTEEYGGKKLTDTRARWKDEEMKKKKHCRCGGIVHSSNWIVHESRLTNIGPLEFLSNQMPCLNFWSNNAILITELFLAVCCFCCRFCCCRFCWPLLLVHSIMKTMFPLANNPWIDVWLVCKNGGHSPIPVPYLIRTIAIPFLWNYRSYENIKIVIAITCFSQKTFNKISVWIESNWMMPMRSEIIENEIKRRGRERERKRENGHWNGSYDCRNAVPRSELFFPLSFRFVSFYYFSFLFFWYFLPFSLVWFLEFFWSCFNHFDRIFSGLTSHFDLYLLDVSIEVDVLFSGFVSLFVLFGIYNGLRCAHAYS